MRYKEEEVRSNEKPDTGEYRNALHVVYLAERQFYTLCCISRAPLSVIYRKKAGCVRAFYPATKLADVPYDQ